MLQTWGNEARLIFLAFVKDLMLTSAWFPTPHESYACFLWLFVFKQAFRSMSLLCDSLSWNKSRAIRECTTCIQFYRITIFLADHPSQHLTPTPVFTKQETTTDKRQFFLEGLKDLQQMIPISVICHIFFGSFKDVLFFRICFKNYKITRGNTTLLHSTGFSSVFPFLFAMTSIMLSHVAAPSTLGFWRTGRFQWKYLWNHRSKAGWRVEFYLNRETFWFGHTLDTLIFIQMWCPELWWI